MIKNNSFKICPNCKIPMVLRKGKFGYFWGCINYPKCKQTYQINGEKTNWEEIYNFELKKLYTLIEKYTNNVQDNIICLTDKTLITELCIKYANNFENEFSTSYKNLYDTFLKKPAYKNEINKIKSSYSIFYFSLCLISVQIKNFLLAYYFIEICTQNYAYPKDDIYIDMLKLKKNIIIHKKNGNIPIPLKATSNNYSIVFKTNIPSKKKSPTWLYIPLIALIFFVYYLLYVTFFK